MTKHLAETMTELIVGNKGELSPEEKTLLKSWFTPQTTTSKQQARHQMIRGFGWELAEAIMRNVPNGPDRSAALRKVREAVMTANAGIACGGGGEGLRGETQE